MRTLSNLETIQTTGGNDFFYAYAQMAFKLGCQLANDGAVCVEMANIMGLISLTDDSDLSIYTISLLATAIGAPLVAGGFTGLREIKKRYQED